MQSEGSAPGASAVSRIRLTGIRVVFWTRCIEDWLVGAIPGIVDLPGQE